MPLKVVLMLDSPLISTGYASTCRLTANELIKRGYEVYGIAFNGGPQHDKIVDWYGIKIIPNYALKRDSYAMYGDAQTVVQIFNEIKPDIFFWHNDSYRYSYIRDLPKEILERSVFWLPFEGEHVDPLGIQLFSKCAATRFVTQHALKIHKDMLKGNDIGNIPHAVDLDAYYPAPDKRAAKEGKKLGLTDKFVVMRIDRHQPRKYWDLTLKAFAKFAKDKPDVFLLAKCNPRDMTMYNEAEKKGVDLEAMAVELGIREKVFFDDFFFSAPAMGQCFFHPADVFLTTTSGEGFGLTPVEAMACGLPVICPDTPVLPEVLQEGALFCKLKGREWYAAMNVSHNIVDVDDVASKLEFTYQDWKNGGKEIARIGAKGREIAVNTYGPKIIYDQWDAVFKDLSERKELVSIVTVLFNLSGEPQIFGEDGINKFKESLKEHVTHPYEWLIVDNGSPTPETKIWLEKAAAENPRIKPIYLDKNMGFAGACNAGIAKAKSEYVILANPDSEALKPDSLGMPSDFIKMMLNRCKSDPDIGIVGMELNSRDDIIPGAVFPYFCNVMISKACLDACKISKDKWLDESFWPAYYEDLDFTMRAMGKGFKIVSANVPFWHKSGGTNKFAIEGGSKGPYLKHIEAGLEALAKEQPALADFGRKRGELLAGGMQGLIQGNIAYIRKKYGMEARQKIKLVWNTHIGASVGFSQIAEGLIPELHKLGFDLYINDWSNGSNVEDPLIRKLIDKTIKAREETDDLESAINIVCWLMETFMDVESDFKVGMSFCESTKVRPQYLQSCNGMDRILTFSNFCKKVQKDSGYTVPIHVLTPGIHPIFQNYYERPIKDKYTFLAVGVAQDRKDTRRLVQAFCETFPKNLDYPPETEAGFPLKPNQVELVIKSNNFGDLEWIQKEGYDKRANIRTIFTGWDGRAQRKDFTMQEMYDLYCEADCLVHPSHGEGIGMPILEAAGTGLPVIFTNWSSPSEYLNDSNSYPTSLGPNGTDFSDAYGGHGPAGENGKWANIHIGHLKHNMRHVIRNREESRDKGRKAAETIKAKFNWKCAAEELVPLIFDWEADRLKKTSSASFDPLTFQRPTLEPIKEGDRVLIDIVTRDRHSYLCSLITSLLGQTFKNWDVIIECDDIDDSMPADHQIMNIMDRCMHEGHVWRIIRSHRQGPHMAHDRTLQMAKDDPNVKYKLVCRIDDDIYVRPDFLEKLFDVYLKDTKAEIAAVSGVYLNPKRSEAEQTAPPNFESDINYAGKIDHNVPWPYICVYPKGTGLRAVEHLYSSFMYRLEAAVAIGGYCKRFSQIGHREESDFSYRFTLAGWKQYIHPEAIGFHFSAPGGGIRANNINNRQQLAESDHKIYQRRLARWKKRAEMRRQEDARQQRITANIERLSTSMANEMIKEIELEVAADVLERKISMAKAEIIKEEDGKIFAALKAEMPKVAIVINGSKDIKKLTNAAIRFGEYSDDVYISCESSAAKEAFENIRFVKMVATSMDETALVTKQLLADGDHEFIMTVTDSMYFEYNPLSLISDAYDDYVFEVFKSYETAMVTTLLGPECQNICCIMRRRKDAKAKVERIFYSDMLVFEDDRIRSSKSAMGHDLIHMDQMGKRNWTKYCIYQYPEGKLNPPRMAEVVSNEKLVSIIIPTAGRKQLLKQCIDSIFAHTSTPFELIIIDNDSNDGTAAYLEAESKLRPNLKHYRQPFNLGYQKAINIGVGKAKGDFILLFNDDAWVTGRDADGRDWLQVYMDELKGNSKLGLVGPHGCDSPALGSRILLFWCVMFRRSLYDEIGTLDDLTFLNYGGDDDYCERVRRAGYEIKERRTSLMHLMTCVPDHEKKPELDASVLKLKAKYRRE